MKKILYLLIATFAITACQKDPDYSELSDEYAVFTTYDDSYQFSSPTTIYVPNSIELLGTPSGESPIWDDSYAQQILDKFVSKFETAGYTVTRTDAPDADLNLSISYLEDVTLFVDYPYWWWDPYYWDSGYWPGWWYPYPIVYGYTVGSLISELVLPNAEQLKESKTLPAKWYSYISGEEYGGESYNTPYLLRGVDQAFKQSPEIKK